MSNIANTLLDEIFAVIDEENRDKLILDASINTIKADWLTLLLARMFGAKTTQTNANGTFVISDFLGTLYMIERKKTSAEAGAK